MEEEVLKENSVEFDGGTEETISDSVSDEDSITEENKSDETTSESEIDSDFVENADKETGVDSENETDENVTFESDEVSEPEEVVEDILETNGISDIPENYDSVVEITTGDFFTKDFEDYTVTEGLLFLIFVLLFIRFCIEMSQKLSHWRMF